MNDRTPTEVSPEEVDYVLRYGGHCRDCADRDGICETGLPCGVEDAKKVIRHVISALNYGRAHGLLASPPAPAAEPVALGPRPCDCERCDCGNVGDAQAVAAWDERAASTHPLDAAAIRAEARRAAMEDAERIIRRHVRNTIDLRGAIEDIRALSGALTDKGEAE